MGLQIGDTIEGTQHDHTARLMLLWLGEDVAVWRYWMWLKDGQWLDRGEVADWDLSCRTWAKVEGAK